MKNRIVVHIKPLTSCFLVGRGSGQWAHTIGGVQVFRVNMPETYLSEREYIVRVLFTEFLHLPYVLEFGSGDRIVIVGPGDKCIAIADEFFTCNDSDWMTSKSIPIGKPSLCRLPDALSSDIVDRAIPIVFGSPLSASDYFYFDKNRIDCGIDIFGSSFFFLSRYEEVVVPQRDEHDRFPDSAALSVRYGFPDRPIVDEYAAILSAMLACLWPALPRRALEPKLFLTHDVDRPFLFYGTKFYNLMRRMVGDVVVRGSIRRVPETIGDWRRVRTRGHTADPFYTFDWIMDLSERYSVRSAFNFIVDHTDPEMDGSYSLEAPEIRALVRRIGERGHEIGLHPSYNSYRSQKQTALEFDTLKRVCREENVEQSTWGGRQHYLRWAGPETFQNWEDAGLAYDSTLGFSKMAGFRCGTSREYSTFNLLNRKALNLRERPMIVMDSAILKECDTSVTANKRLQDIKILSERCRQFGGTLTILIHNSSLYLDSWRDIYETCLTM